MDILNQRQTILIVDDLPDNISILGELLKDDFTIRAATSGEVALRQAVERPPDLILLDVVMPDLDGYEVCRRLKSNPVTQKIPVIFITSKGSDEDEIRGLELGAVDYVAKPFNPLIVKTRVHTHAELKRYRDFLENISYRDGLTGVANRRQFDEYLSQTWNYAVRESSPVSLIMLDIDFFKAFNDSFGHLAGDDCLRRIAEALTLTARRKADLLCRYGGEEFVCVLPQTDLEGATALAEEFRRSVEALGIRNPGSSIAPDITVSLGVATIIPTRHSLPDKLTRAADEALYRSKRNGRNRITAHQLLT